MKSGRVRVCGFEFRCVQGVPAAWLEGLVGRVREVVAGLDAERARAGFIVELPASIAAATGCGRGYVKVMQPRRKHTVWRRLRSSRG
ncbi:MAG: hypothetical protein ACT4PL_14470, partial [Phycisphaerales bacterium]